MLYSPVGSGESFICIILKAILCLVLGFQGSNIPVYDTTNQLCNSATTNLQMSCSILEIEFITHLHSFFGTSQWDVMR